jgi:site-specific recombinase XerD
VFRLTADKVGLRIVRYDLRRDAGSRLLEAGMDLHHVRDRLGHTDMATTNI